MGSSTGLPVVRMVAWRRHCWRLAGAGCLVALGLAGCRTGAPPGAAPGDLEQASAQLQRPLPGDLAALYRLRVPSSGGLRLSVLTAGSSGRVTISEPFGSAVSLTAWSGGSPSEVFDLREGCRFTTEDLSGVLGVTTLPLPQAVRLLGGRLPVVAGDRVEPAGPWQLRVDSRSWRGLVTLAAGPWRVTEVAEIPPDGRPGWRAQLRDHAASVPGWIRVKGGDGRWAELELVRLEWPAARALPPTPELPQCGGLPAARSAGRGGR